MKERSRSPFDTSRRSLLNYGIAAGAFAAAPGFIRSAFAAEKAKTLAIAAPATPLSLDVENSLSLGTIDTVAAFYDYLIGFNTIPDADLPSVMREDLKPVSEYARLLASVEEHSWCGKLVPPRNHRPHQRPAHAYSKQAQQKNLKVCGDRGQIKYQRKTSRCQQQDHRIRRQRRAQRQQRVKSHGRPRRNLPGSITHSCGRGW